MQILKTYDLNASILLDYYSDDLYIYVLTQSPKQHTQLVLFDAGTFDIIQAFLPQEQIYIPKIFPYNEYIYLITDDGIIGYDSLSGQPCSVISVGDLVPMELLFSNGSVFSVCGIPIINTKLETDKICICRSNEESGKKEFQTQNMSSDFIPPIFLENLWITASNLLYLYDDQCKLKECVNLSRVPDYSPLILKEYIVVSSSTGTMEIFSKEKLTLIAKMVIGKSSSSPIKINDFQIIWLTEKDIHLIDLSNFKVSVLHKLRNEIISDPLLKNKKIYASDEKGNLVSFDLENFTCDYFKILRDASLNNPIHAGENLFVSSSEKIYYIGI